jgi:hypothetical protein
MRSESRPSSLSRDTGIPDAATSTARWRHDAALRAQPKRHGLDAWRTPDCLLDGLVRLVLPGVPPGPKWDSAAGDGALAARARSAGYEMIASDIHQLNFLTDPPPVPHLAAIVTNPPFNNWNDFCIRALALMDDGLTDAVVLLARLDHLSAASRAALLNRAAELLVCCWRPRWIVNSTTGPRWSFCWITWRRDHRGPPTVKWIRR